jgi:hypothetical protein
LIQSDKFNVNIGTHPAFSFNTQTATVNGISKELLTTDRYWGSEIVPSYKVSNDVTIGGYYLYAKGLQADILQNGHFIALNSVFSNIKLSNQLLMRVIPMLFYLNLDKSEGFYATSTISLSSPNVPFSLSAMGTKSIKTNIIGKDFVWNVSLTYAF